MHPPSMYSFVTSKKFIPLAIIIILILTILFYGILTASPGRNTGFVVVSPTPVPLVPNQQYVSPNKKYEIKYPNSWEPVVLSQDSIAMFTYAQDKQQYRFTVSPPGQINPEGSDPAKTTQVVTSLTNGNMIFVQTIWENQSIPFFITAIPNDITNFPYFFSMQLPPVNTDSYIKLFDTMVFSFKSNPQN